MNPKPMPVGHVSACPFCGGADWLWASNQYGHSLICRTCRVKIGPHADLGEAVRRANSRQTEHKIQLAHCVQIR